MRLLPFVALFLLSASCDRSAQVGRVSQPDYGFFDLERLFEHQAVLLDSAGSSLNKIACLGERCDSATLRHDLPGWRQELSALGEIHIPGGLLSLNYASEITREGILQIQNYYSLYPEQTAVDSLSIVTAGMKDRPLRIEAVLSDRNKLYSAHRKVQVRFDTTDRGGILRYYSYRGWQRMLGRDTVHIHVTGLVL